MRLRGAITSGRGRSTRAVAERLEDRTLLTTLIALAGEQLLTIDTDHPVTPKATVNIQPAMLDIDNIAVRPSTGQLYGVSPQHVYTLDPSTGAATAVADLPMLAGKVSCSFDPVIDRLRVFFGADSDAPQSMLVNPDTGGVSASPNALAWAPGSAEAGSNPSLRSVAFTNQFSGAASATLYGNDARDGIVAEIGGPDGVPSPDNGTVFPISRPVQLGISQGWSAFTIGGPDNLAFGIISFDVAGTRYDTLYRIHLTSGLSNGILTSYRNLPDHIDSLAAMPSSLPSLSIQDATVSEAASPVDEVFAVTLSRASTSPVTVSYAAVDGTATLSRDYGAPPGSSLTFAPGERVKLIHVPILPDAPNPANAAELFHVVLLNPSGATIARPIANGYIHADGVNILGSIYTETFSNRMSGAAQFDTSGAFHHEILTTFATDPVPSDISGDGFSVAADPSNGDDPALFLNRATDRITFPNLDQGVHVAFAKVDVKVVSGFARVTVIGLNGTYQTLVTSGSQTVSVGEEHVLAGTIFNPTLELGPIREIDLFADQSAAFDNVGVLVIPREAPVAQDFSVTTPPGRSISIDVMPHASEAGGVPLYLDNFTLPTVPDSTTVRDPNNPGQILYTPAPGRFRDSFSYTVRDASGQTATGTVSVIINTPPTANDMTIDLQSFIVGGTARPGDHIHRQLSVSDADGDPFTVSLVRGPEHNNDAAGNFTLSPNGTFDYYLGSLHDTFSFQVSDGTDLSRVATVNIGVQDPLLVLVTGTIAAYLTAKGGLDSLVTDYPFSFTYGGGTVEGGELFGPGPLNPALPGNPEPKLTKMLAFGAVGMVDQLHSFDVNTKLVLVTPPMRGDFRWYDDGSFRYRPFLGFRGTDVFTVEATDGFQFSNPYPVKIRFFDPQCVAIFGREALGHTQCLPPDTSIFSSAHTQDALGDPIRLDAPGVANIGDVHDVVDPSPFGDYPPGTTSNDFPFGFLKFTIDGLVPPPPDPTAVPTISGGVGGHLFSGYYYARFTYVNDDGGESRASPVSNTLSLETPQTLTIHAPPPVPGATGWRAYVADNGSTLYVLQGGINDFGHDLTIDTLTTSGPTPLLLAPPDGPATAPTTDAGGSGSLIPSGNYYIQVTYFNEAGESLPSSAKNPQPVAAGQTLTIHSPPPIPAIGWRAYVSKGQGLPFILQGGDNRIGTDLTLNFLANSGPNPPTTIALPGTTIVKILLPSPERGEATTLSDPAGYFKYGSTPDQPHPHWYSFLFDGHTGAKTHLTDPSVPSGEVDLYFIDGQRGDDDLTVDGSIVDAGGPGRFAPVAFITGPTAAGRGQSRTFTLSAADLSPDILAAGFTYSIDWGDGTPMQTVTATPGNAAGISLKHSFDKIGVFNVRITATDRENQSSPPATFAITITVFPPGDANFDGKVDFADLVILARHYGRTGAAWSDGDFDGDGKVGFDDLVILARNYGTASASPPVPGDADLDGKVDFSDLLILARHYGRSNALWTDGDFDGDGKVDFGDLVVLARNYGMSGSAAVAQRQDLPAALEIVRKTVRRRRS